MSSETGQPPEGEHTKGLPVTMDGHWSTSEGHAMALEYARWGRRDLGMPDVPDFALANAIFMVDRNSLDLIVMQTAAKERIRWLSVQLAIARAAFSRAKP